MNEVTQQGLDFFNPGQSNFWNWADQVKTVVWSDGKTIVYRRDLHTMLNDFKEHGLPPVEAVLMILDACRDNWNLDEFCTKLNELDVLSKISYPPVSIDQTFLNALPIQQRQWTMALDTLKLIAWLPKELRSGGYRALLLKNIFSYCPDFLTPVKEGRAYLYVFGGEIFDHWIKNPDSKKADMRARVLRSLEALSHLPYKVDLEALMRTGVERTPPPLPLPEPESIPQPDDLMTQLANDPQTAGLARLTKRLIAALNIPPHTQGASDQPLGGVSDISNRGDYDRLLISELANDDDTLSARLVNNEALYLRRETPPDPQVQERVILVDTSLRLWGTPRVFAVAAALGCALNNPHKAKVTAFALGQEASAPNALSNKKEVLQFLEKISPVLHPGEALRSFFQQNAVSSQQSVFFITSEDVMADKSFGLMLAQWMVQLNYLWVLNRVGELWMYKVVNGRRSLMGTSVFNLNELLFSKTRISLTSSVLDTSYLPSILSLERFPLFIQTMLSQIKFSHLLTQNSALAITINFELHYWKSKEKGAVVLAKDVPAQSCWFGQSDHPNTVSILGKLHLPDFAIRNKIYVVNLGDETTREINLDKDPIFSGQSLFGHQEVSGHGIKGQIVEAYFEDEAWHIKTNPGDQLSPNYYVVGINHRYIFQSDSPQLYPKKGSDLLSYSSSINKIINNGYSIHHKINSIGISKSRKIKLNNWEIQGGSSILYLDLSKNSIRYGEYEYFAVEFKPVNSTKYGHLLKSAILNDLVEAFIDNRGFLYLRTIDASLPEICLVLISSKQMAAYASDQTYTGNPYFIPDQAKQTIQPSDFYKKYIQPYIDLILQK